MWGQVSAISYNLKILTKNSVCKQFINFKLYGILNSMTEYTILLSPTQRPIFPLSKVLILFTLHAHQLLRALPFQVGID